MFTHIKQHQKTVAAIVLVVLVSGIIFYAFVANAAVRTWDNGGGDGLWSTCTNWSSDTCPTSADIATFDGTSTADSYIDAAFAGSVAGIDINSGYTGKITQQKNLSIGASSYAQDSGTFSQGPYTFALTDGSFTLNTGTFSTATGTNSIERNLTVGGSATYISSSTKVWNFSGVSGDHSTLTYQGIFPSSVSYSKAHLSSSLTIASPTVVSSVTSASAAAGTLTINNGATFNLGDIPYSGYSIVVGGIFNASSTIFLVRDFVLNTTGTFNYDTGTFTTRRSYTDNGGTKNIVSSNIIFSSDVQTDVSVLTCTGNLPFDTIQIAKNKVSASFTLSAGCNATSTTSGGNPSAVTINGTLATEGTSLVGTPLVVGSTGRLRIHANQSMSTPTLNSGSTVDYYGTGTYTTLAGGTSYHHVKFSAGTYNLASNINIAGNLTTTGGTFNQTSGTATFTGSANTISGNHTFNNLTKTVSSASTLTFAAGSTQTVSGTTTLTGTGGATRLTLQSSTPTSQWLINPSGTRVLNYLAITDGNNTSGSPIICYGAVDCTDGGNNTNILFIQPPNPPPVMRLRGDMRIIGGTSLH